MGYDKGENGWDVGWMWLGREWEELIERRICKNGFCC